MRTEQSPGIRREAHVDVPFVDLKGSGRFLGPRFMADLEELMEAGAFTNGSYVDAFERAFAASCGRSICVGVASGLDALRLGLLAMGLVPGDEVIVPAMTFIATFEAVVQAGGTPVVADVRGDDACLDADAAAAAVGPRTRFLLPVHLYGQMADPLALASIAASHDLRIIEDAAQAHGAERDGTRAGALGTVGAFSFYPSKNLGAMGDAGALVTDDEDVATMVRALREHGQTSRYHSDYSGYTSRLDAVQALVLTHKLPHLESWNRARREAAALYSEALTGVGDLRLPLTMARSTHAWHLYTVRTGDAEALLAYLGSHGISAGRHYPQPPHLSPAFAALGLPEGSFPVAEAIARETLSLPIFPSLSRAQIDHVIFTVRAFFDVA